MPPITSWIVTKPTVHTVGDTLKLLYKAVLPKGDINTTMTRTQGKVYKALHIAMKRYEKYKPKKREKIEHSWLFHIYSIILF